MLFTSQNTHHITLGNEQCLKLLLGVCNTKKRGDLSLSLGLIAFLHKNIRQRLYKERIIVVFLVDSRPGKPGGQDEHPGAALLDLYRHPGVRLRARVPPRAQAARQGS
jgi:hypothetical protein